MIMREGNILQFERYYMTKTFELHLQIRSMDFKTYVAWQAIL